MPSRRRFPFDFRCLSKNKFWITTKIKKKVNIENTLSIFRVKDPKRHWISMSEIGFTLVGHLSEMEVHLFFRDDDFY